MTTMPSYEEYGNHTPVFPTPVDETNADLDITPEARLRMYEIQQQVRLFETRAYDLFLKGLVKGTSHLSLGQEAIAAGFGAAMRSDDWTFATYRGHAHTIARGVPLTPIMAELLGRENGLMGGKGGSMHLTSVEHGVMGSYAIIGAHLCVANGAAWTSQFNDTGQVAVAFFGDGTTNIGAFHEAVNFAKVWNLPTVFVCENNLYMEYTPIADVVPVTNPAADRASAYGLDSIIVDGNDADAVYVAAIAALDTARTGGGPSLIEAQTYRHHGHSRADPGTYRPKDEIEAWMQRDPIPMYHQRMLQLGVGEEALTAISQAVAADVQKATDEASDGALPSLDVIYTDVWADGGWAWRN
ncbi:MAG: pyruvate dehydrogenase E1 component alpha subunit [Ilumatobacter sp.]|jgi:pyruvate dehydrogenase E1 component alpha subunit